MIVGSMKKISGLLTALLLFSGCAESMALLGPASTSIGGGNVLRSTLSSTLSYGVKKQTGMSPTEHVLSYAEKIYPDKQEEPCLSFYEKTNSAICYIVKKQLNSTKSKIINVETNKSLKDLTSSLQPNINKKSKIKYLD